jgi:hypothetical protein
MINVNNESFNLFTTSRGSKNTGLCSDNQSYRGQGPAIGFDGWRRLCVTIPVGQAVLKGSNMSSPDFDREATIAAEQSDCEVPSVGVDSGALETPADPIGYQIEYREPDGWPLELRPEQQSLDAAVREWTFDAGLPGGLVTAHADTLQTGGVETPEARQTALQHAWGGEYSTRLATMRELAQSFEAKRPGLVRFLDETHLGDSSQMIIKLEQTARSRGTKKR